MGPRGHSDVNVSPLGMRGIDRPSASCLSDNTP
jgi:hypothetical protein